MTDKFFHRPIILSLPVLFAGIIAGASFPDHTGWTYFVIIICAAVIILKLLNDKVSFLSIAILFFVYGYLSIQPYVAPRFPPDHLIHYADGNKWIITGIIDEKPIKDGDRLKFILRVETLGRNTSVTGNIHVTMEGVRDDLSVGDKVSFVSRIKSIRNFNNPGGFDYERFMASREVWVTASVYGDWAELFEVLEDKREDGGIEAFRTEISELIEETGPGKHVGVLKALIIGDKSEISESVREDFSHAGIAHLLAISGLHIGIIAGAAFVFFRWLLSRFPFFLWEGVGKKGAAILSWFPIIGYGLLAGISVSSPAHRVVIAAAVFMITLVPEEGYGSGDILAIVVSSWLLLIVYGLLVGMSVCTPVYRTVVAATILLMALVIEKGDDPMNTLSLTAVLILVVHPPSLFSASFQLSFSAIFSIIYGHSKLRGTKMQMERKQIRGKLFSFFLVSLLTTLGTVPFVMLYYNQVTLVGLFANFVFIPVIGFVVVPLGLLSVLLHLFGIGWASLCIHISAIVLANTLETVTPTYLEIFGFYVLIWAVLEMIAIHPETSDEKERLRRKRAKVVTAIILFAGIADGYFWINQRFRHDDLRITVIDVGQGSSALVETPGGFCFLMDGGGFPGSSFDVGERILAPFLWHKRIKTLDKIILSHSDADHLNGLLHIVEHFNIKEVWTNNDGSDEMKYQEFMNIIRENRIPHPEFKDMTIEHEINEVCLEILYPPKDFAEKGEKWRRKTNNNSLVVKVTFGEVSFLFPGDIEAKAEKELVEMAGDKLKSVVLIAPHHGSKTSSSEAFLDAVDPEYVVISAGWNNRSRMPHWAVMKRYEERGYEIYRTDKDGAVSISTDGESVRIMTHISSDN